MSIRLKSTLRLVACSVLVLGVAGCAGLRPAPPCPPGPPPPPPHRDGPPPPPHAPGQEPEPGFRAAFDACFAEQGGELPPRDAGEDNNPPPRLDHEAMGACLEGKGYRRPGPPAPPPPVE